VVLQNPPIIYTHPVLWCTVNKTLSLNLGHSDTVCLLVSLQICCYSESKHSIMSLLCSFTPYLRTSCSQAPYAAETSFIFVAKHSTQCCFRYRHKNSYISASQSSVSIVQRRNIIYVAYILHTYLLRFSLLISQLWKNKLRNNLLVYSNLIIAFLWTACYWMPMSKR
jgi:hypothetical protein